jgi:predicted site-specific integrase-resolvase
MKKLRIVVNESSILARMNIEKRRGAALYERFRTNLTA